MTILQSRHDGLILTSDNGTLSGVGGMGWIRIGILTGVALSALSTQSHAEPRSYFVNGNMLHRVCQEEPFSAEGFIVGVIDGLNYARNNDHPYCASSNAKFQQYQDIVCSFVEKNPQQRHRVAAHLIVNALEEAWPCTK